jgi:enoyl-CoA hydratase
LRLSKEALNVNIDANGLEAAIALEDRNQILCIQTADTREAMTAFMERRPPIFNDA